MKKFFMFAALASVALASCVKNEPVATVEQGEAITFDVPVVGVPTKVEELTGTDYPTDRPFHVYAYYTDASTAYEGAAGVKYMDAEATYQSADPVCYSPGNYYWPKTGDLSFFAYSPSSVSANENAGTITFNYTVDTDPTKHVDLLYSDWAIDKTSVNNATGVGTNAYNGIQLAFNHAMSVVKFNFKGTSADVAANIRITAIVLQDVNTQGTLTCDFDETPKAAWSGQGIPGDFDLLKVTPPYQLKATNSVIDTDVHNLILLPQSLTADPKLVISYEIKSPLGNWIEQEDVELQLNTATVTGGDPETTTPLTTWAMNTKYNYTVVFDLNKIYFAPTVASDWAEVTADTL